MPSRQRYGARQPRGRHIPRRQGARHEGVPTLEGQELGRTVEQKSCQKRIYKISLEASHSLGTMSPLSSIQWKVLFVFLNRIIQQLVNGIIAPTAMPNMGMGPWYVFRVQSVFLLFFTLQYFACHHLILSVSLNPIFFFFFFQGNASLKSNGLCMGCQRLRRHYNTGITPDHMTSFVITTHQQRHEKYGVKIFISYATLFYMCMNFQRHKYISEVCIMYY